MIFTKNVSLIALSLMSVLYSSFLYSGNRENRDLLKATARGEITKVRDLLDKEGADINFQNERGMTALDFAARSGDLELVKDLIHRGAAVSLKTNKGKTAMDIAKEHKHYDVAKELRDNGAAE